MNRVLGQSLWAQPESGIAEWSTVPANETYKRLISFEGERLPEPATWAMMLVGFGGLGATMRMTRRKIGNLIIEGV